MASQFSSLSLGQLRTELRRRGAKLSGRKKELIERLEAYERNQNFSQQDDLMPEFTMDLPKTSQYQDINSDSKMAPITFNRALEYLGDFGCAFDDKTVDLYKEKFILYMRLCASDTKDFLKGACKAEMRKQITYIVDISMWKNGQVCEAQCECGAGEGPSGHCKHIKALLYACCKFVKTGEYRVEMSCTEKLQSFHRARKHTGSPLKARDLNLGSADVCDIKDFDPRPTKFRNCASYSAQFYNKCMNFKGISKTPIFQLFKPANTRGATHDHDYLKGDLEENYLKVCKISEISESDIQEIETLTRGQSTNERWLEERSRRIQSSNFHRICTATNRTDFEKLAESLVTSQRSIQTEAMRHGVKNEKNAIFLYEQDKNVKVKPCGIFVSNSLPFLGASPDGIVDKNLVIEVKCPFNARNKRVCPVTVPYLREIDGQLHLSKTHSYYYQIQGQLFCSGRRYCELVVYTLTDIKYIRIERDDDFIAQMVEKLEYFYRNFFRTAFLKVFYYKEN